MLFDLRIGEFNADNDDDSTSGNRRTSLESTGSIGSTPSQHTPHIDRSHYQPGFDGYQDRSAPCLRDSEQQPEGDRARSLGGNNGNNDNVQPPNPMESNGNNDNVQPPNPLEKHIKMNNLKVAANELVNLQNEMFQDRKAGSKRMWEFEAIKTQMLSEYIRCQFLEVRLYVLNAFLLYLGR